MRTVNFQGYKGRAAYTCPCETCGKTLKRTAVVEHTVSPFNRDEDGHVRTPSEVQRRAQEAAEAEAAALQGKPVVCTNCADLPNREMLVQMATEPEKVFPEPETYWNSPMHFLEDRRHVQGVFDDEYNRIGFRITEKGRKRAAGLVKGAS